MNQEQIREISKSNLNRMLEKIRKFKVKRDIVEVETALNSLPYYHCIPEANIIEVIKSQQIKVKNQVVKGEHTNLSTDFFQGFENHVSMSIGNAWTEYGRYTFCFGFEHIDDESLLFCEDPWQWNVEKFEKNVLTKEDFKIYATELLLRNLRRISEKTYFQLWGKPSLHELAKSNFRKWELKQAKNLSILDADAFFVWSPFDRFVYIFVRIFSNPILLSVMTVLLGLLYYINFVA